MTMTVLLGRRYGDKMIWMVRRSRWKNVDSSFCCCCYQSLPSFLLMAAIPPDTWEGTTSATSNSLSSLNRYLSFDVPAIFPELFCGIVRLLAHHINKSKFVVLMAVDPG